MPKILITGASGFVGSWLVREALNQGWETYAGIRSTSSTTLLDDNRIHLCPMDFEDEEGLRQIIGKFRFDVIIHNAGVTRAQNDASYYLVNSTYTNRLARIAMDVLGNELKKFVFISSIEAFGSADPTVNGVVDHNTIPSPRTTYGKSKLAAEQELKTIVDLPLIILRPTAVFGPGERDLLTIWKTIKTFRIAPTIGNANIKYTFIYVKDLVRVVLRAASSDHRQKEYFVSDGKVYRIKEFTSHIAKALDIRPLRFTIPYLVLDGVVGITSVIDKVTGNKSLLNHEQLAKMKALNWDCDISDLVTELSFVPEYNLEDALHETTAWYLDKKWL